MSHSLPNIGFTGFGAYLPEHVLSNDDLAQMVDTSDAWIRRRTGIRTRRILSREESILDMATGAARTALDDAGVQAEDLGDIQIGVNTWLRFPSLATQLQQALGARDASAADISAGCSGFVYALEAAYNKILVEKLCYGRDIVALVIGVDGLSHVTDWTDRGTCVLLGDGAGAVVLRQVDDGGILATHTHADGQYGSMLYLDSVLQSPVAAGTDRLVTREQCARPYLRMNGRKVYGVAVQTMVRDVHRVIEKYNLRAGTNIGVEDIDRIYPHQANLRILEMVAKKLHVPLEKVYTDGIAKYGNTSAASIPIGYYDTRARYEGEPGSHLEIDVAFGSGFASGAVLRKVSATPRADTPTAVASASATDPDSAPRS
jgi:3-oxoacyl-[acyl-carrier-protein] synthase-3